MNLEEIISKLGIGKKETVYLSITPGIGIELIQLNVANKIIKNYAYRPFHYNESLREIGDLESFKTTVSELFAELKISTRCDVVLNIPLVLMGSKELPVLLDDEAITEALISEAEQSYIFKRYEPIVSWQDVTTGGTSGGESRKLYYSAVQKNVIDDIKTVLQELGMNLADIQLSVMSLLRALIYSGFVQEQTKDGISWNLMLVTSNGYSITSMVGKDIIDYYEEPLAIKSFEGEEIYNAVNASAQIALMSFPANYLVLVSETDLISAEILSKRLHFDGKVSFYENNDFKRDNLIEVDYEVLEEDAHKISLEAIGNAVSSSVTMPLEFDFMGGSSGRRNGENPDEPIHVVIGNFEFDISQNGARNVALILSVLLIIPFLLVFISMPMLEKRKQARLDEINTKLQQVQAKVNSLEAEQNRYQNFDINTEVKKVVASNRTKLMGYIAIGESIPKSLWLTYFIANGDGKFDIKGKASNVQDVYTFYRNMRESLVNTTLRLQKLEMDSNSIDDVVSADINQKSMYSFELTNMSQPVPENVEQNENQQNGENVKSTENSQNTDNIDSDDQMLNKPLLNFGKN